MTHESYKGPQGPKPTELPPQPPATEREQELQRKVDAIEGLLVTLGYF